jgi:hypothetical protein
MILRASDNGASDTIIKVLNDGQVIEWLCTSTIAQVKTNLETYATDNPFMYFLPTQRDGVNLIYPKTMIPFASINSVQTTTLTAVLVGGIAPIVEHYTGSAMNPSEIYDLIDTASLTGDFKLLTSATKINNINVVDGEILINNSNIQSVSTPTLGFRTYQYQFPNNVGAITAKEVFTYTYTSPTFGGSDTLTSLTTNTGNGVANVVHTMGALPMQTVNNKAAIKTAIIALFTAAGESYTSITVGGNATTMTITIVGSTWIWINGIILITATPTTTNFVKS